MKVLVLGYGSMGRRHADNARARGHEVAVYDPAIDAIMRGQPLGPLHYMDDLTAALAWTPDNIIIATPADTHAELYRRVVDVVHPVRIFIEKPLATTAREMPSLSPARVVRVGYNLRFHPQLAMVKSMLDVGHLDPIAASFHVAVDGTTWPGQHYADTLLECSHEIDLALWLLGPAVLSLAESGDDGRTWALVLEHRSRGATSYIYLSTAARGYMRGAMIVGRNHTTVSWTWHAPTGASRLRTPHGGSLLCVSADDLYRDELDDFLSAGGHCARLDDGVRVLAICDAARASVAAAPAPEFEAEIGRNL